MTNTITTPLRETDREMRREHEGAPSRRLAVGAQMIALGSLLLAGCDVTNPGPVQDSFLSDPQAHESLVNGAGRQLSLAFSSIGYSGALAAREILPGGQTGSGGHNPVGQAGKLLSSDVGDEWEHTQQARWVAEDALRRFKELPAGKADPALWARAYLYDGFALRLLGESFCDVAFNGGPKEPYTKALEQAQAAFTEAIAKAPATTVGNAIKSAAYGGRASVRVWLKDWAGAVADAKLVTADYAIPLSLDDIKTNGDDLYWANQNSPYRGYTIWGTWFEKYYDQTGDLRAAYGTNAAFPLAQQVLSGYGSSVPWKFATKLTGIEPPHRLTGRAEMLLIQAEDRLNASDVNGAMAFINQVHTAAKNKAGQNLAPLATPATLNDAWALLKRERGIELWLETRRLADLRRWQINKTPGAIDWPDFEAISKLFKDNQPSSCYPIPDRELDTNPNLG